MFLRQMESTMTLKQIPKAALMPEAVYQQLKTAILTGVFQPGQTLRQEDAEIMEIFELRAMLEASLAKAAARKGDPVAVRRLREIAVIMRSLDVSVSEGDQQRWFDLNYELHDILLAVAGRRHHLRVLEIVRALAEPYIRMDVGSTGSFEEAQKEHEGLINAFAAGDCKTLERLTREHVQHTGQRIVEAVSSGKIDGRFPDQT
jgi:DNA-binding GntR family transcriptional regulator